MATANTSKDMEESTSSLPSSSEVCKPENELESEENSNHFLTGEKLRCLGQPFLGKGGDSSVFKGFWKEDGKEKDVAVRRIKISECTANWKDIVANHLTGSLNHDNVLKVLGSEEGPDQFWYFALELYCATLEQFCNGQYTGPIPTDGQVLCQIANGINYLHSKELSHGNLNPQTILISLGQPVRIKISDFGLRKCVKFPKRKSNGNSLHQKDEKSPDFPDLINLLFYELSKLSVRQTRSSTTDDDDASPMLPAGPKVIPRVSSNRARDYLKDSDVSGHPGNWMLAGSWTEFTDQDGNVSIQLNPTVHGDVFAAGCLFLYFLKRGLHPFGDKGTILANISAKNPVNLNKLDQEHFAYKSIKNLIGEPPTDGTQWLQIAAQTFRDDLPLKIDESRMIGKGGFGIVYAGTYEGNDVAVKKMPAEVAEENRIDFEREMKLHKELDHENVLKLLHIDEEKDLLSKYLVLELCSGTLTQYCDKKKRELERKPCKGPNLPDLPPDVVVLYQIVLGLDYIHSQNLVHRDIKPDNVLISITKPAHVKLSDFGFCKKVSPQGTFSQSGLKGTLNWMAPEMLEILNADLDIVSDELPRGTIESDTFSAGCVFFFLLTLGSHPFGNPSFVPANICKNKPVMLHNTIKKLEIGDKRRLYDLIGEMIEKKGERIALTEVMERLNSLIPAENGPFKSTDRSFPQISGRCASRFHPTEPVLACGSHSSSVVLLKGANGSIPFSNWRTEWEFKGQTQSLIRKLEWNVNGTQLAAGCRNGTVIVWSYPSGRVFFEETKHWKLNLFEEKKNSYLVDLIAWNPFRQDVLATRVDGFENELSFWNSRRENGDAKKAHHFHTLKGKVSILTSLRQNWIMSVAWISANQIAIGLPNGEIEICEIDEDEGSSRIVKQFRHSEEDVAVTELQWNERTKYLASSSPYDEWIKIWSMVSDQPVHTLKVHSHCESLAWRRNVKTDNDEREIDVARKEKENFIFACKNASGLQDGSVVIWNPLEEDEENRKRILPQKHSSWVTTLSFSSDGRFLASTDGNGELIIWSTKTWLPVFTCQNYGHDPSWMSTNSSSVPTYKLAPHWMNKVRVFEQSFSK